MRARFGMASAETLIHSASSIGGAVKDDMAPVAFHEGNRALQDRFDTRRIADQIDKVLAHTVFTADDKTLIESRDMFFLATADAEGRPNCSYKGGEPGFVRVVGPSTLALPNYDGNGMYLSMGNLAKNPHVGILFMDFQDPDRLRVNGEASIHDDDPLLSEWPEAQFVVRVEAREIFPNCPRYVHKMALVERSKFVPKESGITPVPEWKQLPWAKDHLSTRDPARSPQNR